MRLWMLTFGTLFAMIIATFLLEDQLLPMSSLSAMKTLPGGKTKMLRARHH